ncbi:MFS transporter [Actinomadura kijaniata]
MIPRMRTYRELFRTPEFGALFGAFSAQVAANTVAGLALGVLVFELTGSPLLSALSMFGTTFAQLLGATLLMSAADRLPPRAAMTWAGLLFAVGTAALALPGMPVWGLLAVVLSLGLVASVGGGVRLGLLSEVLPREGYLLGRSVMNMAAGVVQIGGFGLGGLLVAVLSARGTLLCAVALNLLGAAAAWFGLSSRAPRATGRASVRETWRVNRLLWSSVPRRYAFLAMWVPNGLIVGAEALFVPYSPAHAGTLMALAAVGMLAGDTLVGRFLPAGVRRRLGVPLLVLLAAPYLVFAVDPPLPVVAVATLVAAVGYGSSLVAQELLMDLTPDEMHGQALGLHSSGMMAMQGVAATVAGAVAQRTSPETGIVVMAAASLVVTLLLAPGLRPGRTGRPSPADDGAGAAVRT